MGGTAKLYCHPESDSLFWSDEWPEDGLCEEVSHMKRYRDAALERGIVEPLNAIGYSRSDDPDYTAAKDMVIEGLSQDAITKFDGTDYRFLSNFHEAEVRYDGHSYKTSEHAYQAAKAATESGRKKVAAAPTPGLSKKAGRSVKLREDWEDVKVDVMLDILRAKFAKGSSLAARLEKTGSVHLVEGNTWGDTFWGVCNGKGDNMLGKLLMKVRAENRIPEVTSGSGMAHAITQSYKKWQRKPADLYPTPVDGTESIIKVLKAMKRPDGKPVKRIWEPACGDGRLARVLEWHGFEVISTDLREYPGYGIGGIDFLKDALVEYGWDISEIDAIVTNPPFSLAEEFIRKALTITPNVLILLKQTYWNVISRLPLWEEHMPDMELKLTWRLAFLKNERGNSPLMDCMWCLWCGDNATSEGSNRHCVAEPLKKEVYPGYGGIGILPGMQVLEGEMLELSNCLADLTKRLKG